MKKIFIILLMGLLIKFTNVITIDYGYCYNNFGDGIVLNPFTNEPIHPYYNYICYNNNLMGYNAITICILKPFTIDDIIKRYDIYYK